MSEKKLLKCSVGGCGCRGEVEERDAYVLPLNSLASRHECRSEELEIRDLEKSVFCPSCKRVAENEIVAMAEKQGRPIDRRRFFHPFRSSVALLQSLKAEKDEHKERVLATLKDIAPHVFCAEPQASAEVLDHPTRKSGKGGEAAPRKRAGSKKAVG